MGVIFDISVRNLLRQKRRNLLLGVAIAFGMMVLVVANSFSHGISDSLLNRIVVYVAGHMELAMVEEGRLRTPIIRDKDRFLSIISANVTDVKQVNESLGVFVKGIGNGKSDNMALVGSKPDKDFYHYLKLVTGNFTDFETEQYHNPLILSTEKAKALNVGLHDVVRVRLQTINGQQQTDTLTVIAITQSQNMFMDMAVFLRDVNLKKLVGMKPHETGGLQIILNDSTTAGRQADRLYQVLTPNLAVIPAQLSVQSEKVSVRLVPFYRDPELVGQLTANIRLVSGQAREAFGKDGVLISHALALSLGVRPGDKLSVSYANKFVDDTPVTTINLTVAATYQISGNRLSSEVLLLSEDLFYRPYYRHPPRLTDPHLLAGLPVSGNLLYPVLGKEWTRLPRTATSEAYMKKFKKLTEKHSAVAAMDVRTMYETASSVLQMEKVLNLITLCAVLILFFIILIGVVNTLRMTIRERTREIGTVRAIGMQRRDVRNIFMLETLLLTFTACAVGTLLGFVAMGLMGLHVFSNAGAFSIVLVDYHLHFVPTVWGITSSFVLILLIAAATAYFPARRAARMSVANALGKYD